MNIISLEEHPDEPEIPFGDRIPHAPIRVQCGVRAVIEEQLDEREMDDKDGLGEKVALFRVWRDGVVVEEIADEREVGRGSGEEATREFLCFECLLRAEALEGVEDGEIGDGVLERAVERVVRMREEEIARAVILGRFAENRVQPPRDVRERGREREEVDRLEQLRGEILHPLQRVL